jgi:hypothetical protein
MSKNQLQVVESEVKYLGHLISEGKQVKPRMITWQSGHAFTKYQERT